MYAAAVPSCQVPLLGFYGTRASKPAAACSSSAAYGWSGSQNYAGLGYGAGSAAESRRLQGRIQRAQQQRWDGGEGTTCPPVTPTRQFTRGGRRGVSLVTAAVSEPVSTTSGRVAIDNASTATASPRSLRVDFLVIGSGISGLSYALEAAKVGKVAVVTKDVAYEGSTHYAQGGISAVISPEDTVEEHIRDTQVAGDFLCDDAAVEVVCSEGREAVEKLMQFGADFTKDEAGNLHLAREGGHGRHRIVHAADMTGREIERALLESARAHPNVTFYEHHMAKDLITVATVTGDGASGEAGTMTTTACLGAEIVRRDTGETIRFLSSCTLLAAGGAGQLFPSTTNPSVSTGDGVAMAVRGGAAVANMEFYQFHPTSLYTGPGGARKKKPRENAFLVTEAVRGHGGRLFNAAGERFMAVYDDRLELAPRDVVARAIDREIKAATAAGNEAACVYLDISHLPAEDVLGHFPGIAAELASRGIDMAVDRIPVTPAAHYLCGGVQVDLNGQTSVAGLFACGETAHTGVHGANRLASNSLLEAVVFANRSVKTSSQRFADKAEMLEPLFRKAEEDATDLVRRAAAAGGTAAAAAHFDEDPEWARVMRGEVQRVMWSAAGIVRDTKTLRRARAELEIMLARCESEMLARGAGLYAHELRNLITVGLITVHCASARKESRGLHYNVDFPDRVEGERRPTLVTSDTWVGLSAAATPAVPATPAAARTDDARVPCNPR
eukprot:CAMPEP_0181349688 /NCGR_PEP_ID=MMETSP1106-20121128/860_1 /TAXON_ID=81844 /ORGANISM="Mantoniella antarctica, Strain SL-175" /LENGTH=726 /DNA_ID=CAMNT_0023462099 /DNA_START=387 /DNA_END=2567 /DNA_ORIENTATION=+